MKSCDFFSDTCVMSARPQRRVAAVAAADQQAQEQPAGQGPRGRGGNRRGLREPPPTVDLQVK